MAKRHRDTEVDAYVFIKENLRDLGWDTRNPARVPAGQVFTQNECLADPEIQTCLGLERPENVVKVTEKVVWLIEAKRSHAQLQKAIADATNYAAKLLKSKKYRPLLASGVAGNAVDTFLIRNFVFLRGKWFPVKMNGIETTGLLSPEECRAALISEDGNIAEPRIDVRLFLSRAEYINEILHLGAVNPHQRASVMAALLLAMLSDTPPNIEAREASVLIGDINTRVRKILKEQGKENFYEHISLALPATEDNHTKFRQALVDTLQELNNLNIRSAMNSGADWLGAFYEVFLKYANWAQDLGIVLTPRHITRYVANVMSISSNDIILDPTCGTGGFLVAAFDSVKKTAGVAELGRFKRNCVFGIEQETGVAALAVVNMIFRGDGKNNIIEGNCFAKQLEAVTVNGSRTARFVSRRTGALAVTKVMMNPPFALRRSDEKEYKFVDRALTQMQDGGILFSVLPYSALTRPREYLRWRRDVLLPSHTLLAVVTFPIDLFYPIGVTTAGIFVRKGRPHPRGQPVLWVRAISDGFLKSKSKRLPNDRAANDLESVAPILQAFLQNPMHPVANVHQLSKASPIDWGDSDLEIVPEAYLDQAGPTHARVLSQAHDAVRNMFAFLVRINRAEIPDKRQVPKREEVPEPTDWRTFTVTDFFNLERGSFHSIADLDPGTCPTVSRIGTDNGFVGFFERPHEATIWQPGTITVSSVSGDAFLQPEAYMATDNVVICVPKQECVAMPITSRLFIALMIDDMKWRYSYGRQPYKTKFAKTQIMLPVEKSGRLAETYMARVIKSAPYWPMVAKSFG